MLLAYGGKFLDKFPLLNEFSYQKPYKELKAVADALEYTVTLNELGLSKQKASDAGYVLVLKAVAKRRPALWLKSKDLELFEKAEAAVAELRAELLPIEAAALEKKIIANREEILEAAFTALGKRYDTSSHIDLMSKFQVRAERAGTTIRHLLDKLDGYSWLDLSEFKHAMSNYQNSLSEGVAEAVASHSEALQQYTNILEDPKEWLKTLVFDPCFAEDFREWADDQELALSKNNLVTTALRYLWSMPESPGLDEVQTDLAALKRIERALGFEALLSQIHQLNSDIEKTFEIAIKWTLDPAPLTTTDDLLPSLPHFDLKLSSSLDTDLLQQDLEQRLGIRELGRAVEQGVLECKPRRGYGLELNYEFRFLERIEGYPCELSIQNHWQESYKGVLRGDKRSDLALDIGRGSVQQLAPFLLYLEFLQKNQIPTAESLKKKWDKFQATCQLFIDTNQEKPGFHHFATNPSSLRCQGLKQAKNFKTSLEKRFSEYCLARLATDHADIFMGRRDRRVRKVTFFAGPTNSGKSYMAFEKLAKANSGVYLGPLRLLALEGVEELSKRGVRASLITGEERDIDPKATHVSQTIETYDREANYSCAIIDEIQMISDKGRGGAFMEALLNINADDVVLTGSSNAVEIVREICSLTGDLFEVHYLERKNPLKWVGNFTLPRHPSEDMKGTAIVAFSKKSIHQIRNFMLDKGYTVSVIYGALSPDVRRSEAERFRSGETDILVATDAIGMGLNLPIKRVLFSQSNKFDGEEIRDLSPTEVLQIGGRAGRYGMFQEAGEVGVIANLTKIPVESFVIQRSFNANLAKLNKVYVSITHKQLYDSYQTLTQDLSTIIKTLAAKNQYTWSKARPATVVDNERYEKALLLEEAATLVGSEQGLQKNGSKVLRHLQINFATLFRLINSPFDCELYRDNLLECFANIIRILSDQKPHRQTFHIDTTPIHGSVELEHAEKQVKLLTLHYYFSNYFEILGTTPYELDPDEILLLRKELGIRISQYLAKNEALKGVNAPRSRGGWQGQKRDQNQDDSDRGGWRRRRKHDDRESNKPRRSSSSSGRAKGINHRTPGGGKSSSPGKSSRQNKGRKRR